jgi:hypothetical protein
VLACISSERLQREQISRGDTTRNRVSMETPQPVLAMEAPPPGQVIGRQAEVEIEVSSPNRDELLVCPCSCASSNQLSDTCS